MVRFGWLHILSNIWAATGYSLVLGTSKTYVITGANSGIGFETTQQLQWAKLEVVH